MQSKGVIVNNILILDRTLYVAPIWRDPITYAVRVRLSEQNPRGHEAPVDVQDVAVDVGRCI